MTTNKIIGLALVWASTLALGGIGAGNGFKHVVRPAFNFHIAYPPGWDFREQEVVTELGCGGDILCAKWSFSNEPLVPDAAEISWLHATFILNAPATNLESLVNWAQGLHPEINAWYTDENGPFAMIRSDDESDGSNGWKRTEYYLTESRQVVRVVWRAHVSWRNSIDHIINSIDKAASQPEILKIETEPTDPTPGNEACLRIEVNDLRGAFEKDGLRLTFQGQVKHYSLKQVEWVGESNWFRVCVNISSAFGSDGLYPSELVISAKDGRSRRCALEGQRYKCEQCVTESSRIETCDMQFASFPVAIPVVQNPTIDRQGPEFIRIHFEEASNTLLITAQDPSGIAIGEVYSDRGETMLILPDQGATGTYALDVAPLTSAGWNTIKAIYLYDKNGVGGMLRDQGDHTYRYHDSEGRSVATDFPVINFFSVEAK